MTAPWAVLVHGLILTPQVRQPLPSHGLQWQQHFISRQLRARLYKCTRTRTKVSSKQLLRFKSTLIPSASLTRVGTLEQGSACCGREPAFWGGLWWKQFTGRGSALLEAWDINGNAFSVQQQAAEELFFIFLFLSPPQGKAGVKGTHTRNISRKGWLKQLQSYPKRRCSKAGSRLLRARSNLWWSCTLNNWTHLMIASSKDKEILLTPNIPRSHSNSWKPQAQPLVIQLFAT